MTIHFLKFIHLLCTLGLLSGTLYCVTAPSALYQKKNRLNETLLALSFLAIYTGTLLVYPKHFTFHTPWIQAAYLLASLVIFGIVILMMKKNKPRAIYAVLIVLFIFIIHDAVTKTSLLQRLFQLST